jgi:hypothetical protein
MNIVIATCDDWDAIYIDGVNKMEEHTLYAADIVYALEGNLPCTIESIEIKNIDDKWWWDEGLDCYPDFIEDVVFEEE